MHNRTKQPIEQEIPGNRIRLFAAQNEMTFESGRRCRSSSLAAMIRLCGAACDNAITALRQSLISGRPDHLTMLFLGSPEKRGIAIQCRLWCMRIGDWRI